MEYDMGHHGTHAVTCTPWTTPRHTPRYPMEYDMRHHGTHGATSGVSHGLLGVPYGVTHVVYDS